MSHLDVNACVTRRPLEASRLRAMQELLALRQTQLDRECRAGVFYFSVSLTLVVDSVNVAVTRHERHAQARIAFNVGLTSSASGASQQACNTSRVTDGFAARPSSAKRPRPPCWPLSYFVSSSLFRFFLMCQFLDAIRQRRTQLYKKIGREDVLSDPSATLP
jgi:hypothetical protein